jgi:hypothetical protein
MRSFLLSRAAGVIAIAATAAFTMAGTASAAPAVSPRHATSLSIRASKTVDRAGHPVVISGVLRSGMAGLAGKVVVLDRALPGRAFVPVAARITGKFGGVAFVRTPGITVRYKLVFPGSVHFTGTHSGIVTVKVIK